MTREGFSNIIVTKLACVHMLLILGLSMPYGINLKQYYLNLENLDTVGIYTEVALKCHIFSFIILTEIQAILMLQIIMRFFCSVWARNHK